MIRRFAALATAAVGLVVLGAAPALAQEAASTGADSTMVVIGAISAGVALFLLIFILFGPNSAVERDLRTRLGTYSEADDRGRFSKSPLLRRFVSQAEDVAERRGLLTMIETALEQANLPLRAGEAIAGAIAAALLGSLLVGLITQSIVWALVSGVGALLVAGAMVQSLANKQRTRFEGQLPDTLNLIATSLRAGYSLLQAVEAVSSEAPDPTAREFSRAINETRLGRSPVDALKDVADRMQSVDFDWAVLAISIQREVGGNLAEVLQTAADTMLQRNRLRREMKALTAEGRISAIVLGLLPFALFGFLFVSNRTYIDPLISTAAGLIALIVAGVLLLAGIFWLTRIVKVDV